MKKISAVRIRGIVPIFEEKKRVFYPFGVSRAGGGRLRGGGGTIPSLLGGNERTRD